MISCFGVGKVINVSSFFDKLKLQVFFISSIFPYGSLLLIIFLILNLLNKNFSTFSLELPIILILFIFLGNFICFIKSLPGNLGIFFNNVFTGLLF